MKYAAFLALPLLLAGCFNNYRQSAELDLPPGGTPIQQQMPSVKIGVIRNSSGVGLPVIIRLKNGLVETDKYARWLLSPDQMLERELHRSLNTTDSPAIRLSGNVLTCEFDQADQQAVLEVSFEVRKKAKSQQLKKRFTAPVQLQKNGSHNDQAAAMARAMGDCYRQACLAAAELIKEFDKQK